MQWPSCLVQPGKSCLIAHCGSVEGSRKFTKQPFRAQHAELSRTGMIIHSSSMQKKCFSSIWLCYTSCIGPVDVDSTFPLETSWNADTVGHCDIWLTPRFGPDGSTSGEKNDTTPDPEGDSEKKYPHGLRLFFVVAPLASSNFLIALVRLFTYPESPIQLTWLP